MNNNIKKVWVVHYTHDEYGRYDEVDDLIGVYETKEKADKASRGNGWYGGDGNVEERHAVLSDGKWYLTQMPFPVQLNKKHLDPRKVLRKKALNKLTAEEKEALEIEE